MSVNSSPTAQFDNGLPEIKIIPTHIFRLRPDCTLRLELPDDLTRVEVKRLHFFLKSVTGVGDDLNWPFSPRGKSKTAISDDWDELGDCIDEDEEEFEDDDLALHLDDGDQGENTSLKRR
jgi:hypothetical protein